MATADDRWEGEVKESDAFEMVTVTDVQLAAAYFPILVEVAKQRHTISYSDLVARAKEDNPENSIVQNAIPVSVGRRLEVLKIFTDQRALPDLASLVVGKKSGEVGSGYRFDPVAARITVFDFDWSAVALDFDQFAQVARKKVEPTKKITPQQARNIMYGYYRELRARLPAEIAQHRDRLLELIEKGVDVDRAFSEVIHQMGGPPMCP